jgi:glycosyl transferase family 25
MKIFVINLERDTERRKSIQTQFDQLLISFEFSTGVLGSTITPQQKAEWYDDKKAFRNKCTSIVPAHIGCSLSHVNVYRKILEQNLPYALILEDDVILPINFISILNEIENVIKIDRAEVILLSPAVGIQKETIKVNKTYYLTPYKNGFYTSSYIVTNKAAQTLIKELFPICDVADCWPRLKRHRIVDIYNINPHLIEQDQDTFGSSTNADTWKYHKKGIYSKIRHKTLRAFWLSIDFVLAFFHRNLRPYHGILK